MAKAKNKTVPTRFTAEEYLANIEDEARRSDCQKILDMMQEISGDAPKIWGVLVNIKSAKPASILNGYQMWMKAC